MFLAAGSKYAQTGVFEVTKAEDEPSTSTSPPPSPGLVPPIKPTSALRVTVPSELQGVAYIKVTTKCIAFSKKLTSSMGFLF